MTSNHVIKLSAIMHFFDNNKKMVVRGVVHASMKDETYICEITIKKSRAIQCGKTHEKDGLDALKSSLGIDVMPTGIWLYNSGILGAISDGLVSDNAIVEVKCTYAFRNDLLSEKFKNNKFICYYNEKNELVMNQNHNYYHHVQGNLYILKREKCFLYIWTLKELIIVEIQKDPYWEVNLTYLEDFYINHYFPKLR